MGETASINVGQAPDKNEVTDIGLYPFINAGTTPSGYISVYNSESETITTPSRGQGGIGFVGYQKTQFWCGPLCYKMQSKNELSITKYVYYYLQNINSQILELKHTGSVPALNRKELEKIVIPVPPLAEQERIVEVLDKFDALVNDISVGLPAEIAARRKQYEYYRGKLLDFKNVNYG